MKTFEIFTLVDVSYGKRFDVIETVEAEGIEYTPAGFALYGSRGSNVMASIVYTIPAGCGVKEVHEDSEPMDLKTQSDVLKAYKEGRLVGY